MKGLCQKCYMSNTELIFCRGKSKCFACYNKDKCDEVK